MTDRFNLRSIFKKFSFSLIILVLIFCGCLAVLYIVSDLVFEDRNLAFDQQILGELPGITNHNSTKFWLFITFFGSQTFLLPANILLMLIFFLIKKARPFAWKIAVIALTSTAVLFLLKFILQRERPLVPLIAKAHGYSFPSGHSFTSFIFFGMLAYIAFKSIRQNWLKWALASVLFFFPFLIAFSRVYLRLHYATDVIAGLCLGIIWLILAWWFLIKRHQAS